MAEYPDDSILGLYEYVTVISPDGKEKKILARIDSGATKSSIDIRLAAELNLGPIVGIRKVRNSMGQTNRPMIKVSIKLKGRRMKMNFTLSDRKDLTYPMLIGQNILKRGFIIDPQKKVKK